jgi:hypothetical protein
MLRTVAQSPAMPAGNWYMLTVDVFNGELL